MTVNIKVGNSIVVTAPAAYASRRYEVKGVSRWNMDAADKDGFAEMATFTVNVEAPPETVGGRQGAKAGNVVASGLDSTPIDPASQEDSLRLGLQTPVRLYKCYVADGGEFLELLLEDEKPSRA